MDEEAALLPHATLTTAGRAQVLAELVAAAGAVGAARAEGLLSRARWAVLFITVLLRVLDLTHDIALLLLGTATGTERGKDAATGARIAKSWRGTGFRVLVDQEIEHSKLHQSTEAEDEADGNIEIQRCDIGHTWEILPGIGTQ